MKISQTTVNLLVITIFSFPFAFGAYQPDAELTAKLNTAKQFIAELKMARAKKSNDAKALKEAQRSIHYATSYRDPQIIARRKEILETSGLTAAEIETITNASHDFDMALFNMIKVECKILVTTEFPDLTMPAALAERDETAIDDETAIGTDAYLEQCQYEVIANDFKLTRIIGELRKKYPQYHRNTRMLDQEIDSEIEYAVYMASPEWAEEKAKRATPEWAEEKAKRATPEWAEKMAAAEWAERIATAEFEKRMPEAEWKKIMAAAEWAERIATPEER